MEMLAVATLATHRAALRPELSESPVQRSDESGATERYFDLRRCVATQPSLDRSLHSGPICQVVSEEQRMRIAVGFYGVHRSTGLTAEGIQKNMLEPLQKVGAIDVFVHSMLVAELENNAHTREAGVDLCQEEYLLLRACTAGTVDQADVDRKYHLREIAETAVYSVEESIGWRNLTGPFPRAKPPVIADEGVRLNILRSRYSMQRVARLMTTREVESGVSYTHIMLARPDVGILSPLVWKPPPPQSASMWLRVPNMQHYSGVNDRLAYGSRDALLYAANEVGSHD